MGKGPVRHGYPYRASLWVGFQAKLRADHATLHDAKSGWNAVGHDVQVSVAGIGIPPDDVPLTAEFDNS